MGLRGRVAAMEQERNQLEGLVRNLRAHTHHLEESLRTEHQRTASMELQLRDYSLHAHNPTNVGAGTVVPSDTLVRDQFEEIRRLRAQLHDARNSAPDSSSASGRRGSGGGVAEAIHGTGTTTASADSATQELLVAVQKENAQLRLQLDTAQKASDEQVGALRKQLKSQKQDQVCGQLDGWASLIAHARDKVLVACVWASTFCKFADGRRLYGARYTSNCVAGKNGRTV